METGGGDGSETGLVMTKKEKKPTTGIGASLTPDYRNKEESNNNIAICDNDNSSVIGRRRAQHVHKKYV